MSDPTFIADQIFALSKLLKQLTEATLKPYGLGTGQLQILLLFYRSDSGLSQAQIVSTLGVDKANVSRSLTKLLERGYLMRQGSKLLVLSPSGQALKTTLIPFFQETQGCMTQGIAPRHLTITADTLEAMIASIQKEIDHVAKLNAGK